jgi:hypothetical protein
LFIGIARASGIVPKAKSKAKGKAKSKAKKKKKDDSDDNVESNYEDSDHDDEPPPAKRSSSPSASSSTSSSVSSSRSAPLAADAVGRVPSSHLAPPSSSSASPLGAAGPPPLGRQPSSSGKAWLQTLGQDLQCSICQDLMVSVTFPFPLLLTDLHSPFAVLMTLSTIPNINNRLIVIY